MSRLTAVVIISELFSAGVVWGQATNVFPTSGNVGIGTTNPTGQLQIQAPSGVGGSSRLFSVKDSTGAEKAFIDGLFQYNGIQYQDSGPNAVFSLTDTGVGLALNSWAHITWSSNGTFYGSQDVGLNRNASGVLEIYDGSNSANIRDLRVRALNPSGGNLGIGTTNPQYALSVNGTIQAKEVIVNTGWADYVFKPDYRLPPLSEVAEYIAKHGHLPEMPSEADVLQRGARVGEIEAKLLAKIEELTLHMIQMEKKISALESQNRELLERNTHLSSDVE